MYENGDASFAEAILTATSYSDLVNKSEYVEKVHGYDRNKLMEYVQTKEEVANLKTELEGEQAYGSHGAGDEFTTGKFGINFNPDACPDCRF